MPKSSGPTPEQQLKKAIALYEELEAMKSKQNADAAEELKDEEEDGDEDNSSASEAIASVTKYAVTLRSSAPGANEFCDWVPVAILSLACGKESNPTALMPGAVGATIREILEGGCQAFPSLRKVGRETLEYSFEPLDSFETHVFDGLQGRSDRRKEAAKTLGIESSASAAEVKKAHRKLMQQLHPDMFIGDEKGAEKANERMLEVQEAYGELGGGQGSANQGSFYERIGGKARVDFSGALAKEALAPIGKPRPEQDVAYEKGGWRAGVIPMSTSITQEFVTRNLVRS